MKKNLVVGAGISGAVIANLIANNLNEEVLIIDKKEHIAGNCYDFRDKNGVMIHKYGSHIFHTSNETVWNYLNQFSSFNKYEHKVYAIIEGREVNIPFNLNSINTAFSKNIANRIENKLLSYFEQNKKIPILDFLQQEDEDLIFLANYIYEKVFLNYTIKQWGVIPNELDKSVTARVPIYISHDNRYFQDKYQGIPVNGYTELIKRMLDHKNISIRLNTDYKNFDKNFDRIFYTGSIDDFFDYKYGLLPYRSVYFKFEEHEKEFYQSNSVINYPNNEDFTRIHEYKYYLNDKSPKTIIAKEYSEAFELGKNERFYPIPQIKNNILYNKYLEKANLLNNVYFLGRLGDYKYYDIDKAVARAIEVFENLREKNE